MFEAAKVDHDIAVNWWECYVIVTADLGPAGEAFSSLSGLNWAVDEDYILGDVVDEMLDEAEAEAERIFFHRILGGNVNLYPEVV